MINSLTSWRFIFAVIIFLHHYSFSGGSVFPAGGNLAVSFFFLLSRFVLAYSYGDKILHKEVSYKNFLLKRIIRIYPVHFFTFLGALFLYIGTSFLQKEAISGEYLALGGINLLLLQSWIPLKVVYFSYNAVSWCLSDEIFFYVLFPLLVPFFITSRFKRVCFVLGLLIAAYLMAMYFIPKAYIHSLFYINPLFRSVDFIIGIFLYKIFTTFLKNNRPLPRHGMTLMEGASLLVIAGLLWFLNNNPGYALYAVYYWLPLSFLILTFVVSSKNTSREGEITKFLSHKIGVYLGNTSFCFFMIHQLVIRVLYAGSAYFHIDVRNWSGLILAFFLSLLGGICCYHLIELPLTKYFNSKLKR